MQHNIFIKILREEMLFSWQQALFCLGVYISFIKMQLHGLFFLWIALQTMQCISISNEMDPSVITINGDTFDIESPPDKREVNNSITSDNQKNDISINSPNSDEFVDLILVGARRLIKDQGLDPAELPDAIAKFSKTILGIKIWGSAKVRNGWLQHF